MQINATAPAARTRLDPAVAAVWSFLVPATALVGSWLGYGAAFDRQAAYRLAGLAVMDLLAAATGMWLVSRAKGRAWALAGTVASSLAIATAGAMGLAAALVRACSGLMMY